MKRLTLAGIVVCSTSLLRGQDVTYERIRNAAKEQQNWLTYWGDYSAIRHRDLKQITTANVKDLRVEWMFQTGVPGASQSIPLVVDGILYFTGGNGTAFAVDAKTGRQLWQYRYQIPTGTKLCCGQVNRGLAMLGNRLFMTTPDAYLLALDARTGTQVWKSQIAPWQQGYGSTMAPLVVKDKVIVGVSGGEYGIRGLVDAYNATTGERAWRFYTIPEKGEFGGETWNADSWKRGGAPTWTTGTFDPELNTLYWPTGNPGPDLYGPAREGDNLFSCSVLALDPDTGKRKWHFQFTPHDVHDWDANEAPMLLDLPWQGKPRKLLLQANRNGFFYVLDRVTGEFLSAKPFARQTWAKEIDAKGRPVVLPNSEPSPQGTRVCPGLAGSTNWMAPSYNPQTKMFYLSVREQCDVFFTAAPSYQEGKPYWGSVFRGVSEEKEWGEVRALDPLTAESKWSFRLHRAPWAGTLSTSSGLLFAGDEDGYLIAFDAATGKNLWRFNTGNRLTTAPITFLVDGRQYVTMPSGSVLITFALPR